MSSKPQRLWFSSSVPFSSAQKRRKGPPPSSPWKTARSAQPPPKPQELEPITHSTTARYHLDPALVRIRINLLGIYVFIAVNAAVFLVWTFWARGSPPNYQWMLDNFTMSARNLDAGRWWTLLTAQISHEQPIHAIVMGYVMHNLAQAIAMPAIQPVKHLATLMLTTAATSAAGYIVWDRARSDRKQSGGLGASGIMCGMAMALMCISPMSQWMFFFFVPAKGWQMAVGLVAFDMAGLCFESPIAHAAHLGGSAGGLLWWLVMRRTLRLP